MQTVLSCNSALVGKVSTKKVFAARKVAAARVSTVVRASDAAAAEPAEKAEKVWSPPALNPSTPSPIFGGSTGTEIMYTLFQPASASSSCSVVTGCNGSLQISRARVFTRRRLSAGGLLRKAQVEEFHVITWESKKEQIFEMPTGGAAIMRQGPNLLKLARKEQCLALLTQLRTKFKIDGFIYRVFPNGEVQYLHPKASIDCSSCPELVVGPYQLFLSICRMFKLSCQKKPSAFLYPGCLPSQLHSAALIHVSWILPVTFFQTGGNVSSCPVAGWCIP